ncbi:MAG: PKD domain-containing protein [Bacteroidota bacterium]|nr:MAG: PKD domain-containing protein [Bacteroidota bacterium]
MFFTAHNNPNRLIQIALLIVLFFGIVSCEQETENTIVNSANFDIPVVTTTNQAVSLISLSHSQGSQVQWTVSDGNVYELPQASHTFASAGKYTILLEVFLNNKLNSSIEKQIEVLDNGSILKSDSYLKANYAVFTGQSILLSVNKSGQSGEIAKEIFYLLNTKLKAENRFENTADLKESLGESNFLGDSILAINMTETGSKSFLFYKSSDQNDLFETSQSNPIDYNEGILFTGFNAQGNFKIDFFDETRIKVWTKVFSQPNASTKPFLFNLNNKLYYLNFNASEKTVFIEKFKNPSVVFESKTIPLSETEMEWDQLLFVIKNPLQNSIDFAVYSKKNNTTSLYRFDENCALSKIGGIDKYFAVHPENDLLGESFLVKDGNKLIRYNTNWNFIEEKAVSERDFGYCQLGDNLYMVFENLSTGQIRLSYIDKHFNPVFF